MNTLTTNIGTWVAKVEPLDKGFVLKVNGEFPYRSEKRDFALTKSVPQGINRKELLLTLSFAEQVNPQGANIASVYYSEQIDRKDLYEVVTVPGPRDRNIASMNVED
jgi:hypothetical protein